MTPEEYQELAARTLLSKPPRQYSEHEIMLIWNSMGVAGEAGEFADDVKKMIFHDKGIDIMKIIDELGDILWYIAGVCTKLGVSLDMIMQYNIDKLKARYPSGFKTGGGIRNE